MGASWLYRNLRGLYRNLVYRFMCRLQASNNSLVMSIQSSSLVYIRLEFGSTGDVYCMCMGDSHIHAISVFRAGLFKTYSMDLCIACAYCDTVVSANKIID